MRDLLKAVLLFLKRETFLMIVSKLYVPLPQELCDQGEFRFMVKLEKQQ
jgi:hypothetical protein